jgi:hypothetical protein
MTKRGRPRKHTLDFSSFNIHPAANLLPPMSAEEFAGLVEDIKKNGLREPVTIIGDGCNAMILEGRHRELACQQAGIVAAHRVYLGDDPVQFVLSANIHRRHLTPKDRRKLIGNLLKLQPELSDRQIGEKAKASHHTVASVRAEEESRGQFAHVETHTDSKGRKQPARKARPAKPPRAVETPIHQFTGNGADPPHPPRRGWQRTPR